MTLNCARLKEILYSNSADVITSAKNICEIFPDITQSIKDNMTTLYVANKGSNVIYYGKNNTVTTSNGFPLEVNEQKEFYIVDITKCPYFIGPGTDSLRIIIWK